jgi:5-formyltetrahydrofolate cyclo-ligase
MTTKAELRIILKERREALSLGDRRAKGYYITCRLQELLKPYQTILAYVAKDPEVESMVIINCLLEEGKTVLVPIIEKETHTLRLSYLTSMDQLEPGTFRVPEPLTKERPAPASSVDAVLVPMVGFDRAGHRLGYGAGYYDRFFEANPAIPRIGMAYACQEAEGIPTEEYDARMDQIVTEDEVIRCG